MLTVNTAISSQKAAPSELATKFARYCSSRAALSSISARNAPVRFDDLATDGPVSFETVPPDDAIDHEPRGEPRELPGEAARDVILPSTGSGKQRHRKRNRVREPEQR